MARPRTKRNYTGREKIIFTSVSHRDAPLSVELAGVTYPSPYYRIRHNPASSYVFEYVLEGRGWIEYERERLTVQEGDFYLIQQSTACTYGSDYHTPYKKIWLNAEGELVGHLLAGYGLVSPVVIVHKNVEHLFREIHRQLLHPSEENPTLQLTLSFHELIAFVSETECSQILKKPLYEQIRDYIDFHLGEPLRLELIAERFYISRAYLARIFQQAYHQSPYDYILKRKMQVACNMLVYTRMPVQEIAMRLSFGDPHYFSNAFKKVVGKSPRDYRQSMGDIQMMDILEGDEWLLEQCHLLGEENAI